MKRHERMTMMPDIAGKRRYDFVVVGARCAGASVAMLLARAGAKVLVIDRQEYGSDRLSTHALMRGAVMQLKHWGVLETLIEQGTPKITRTVFHYGAESIPVAIKPEWGVDWLIAPRRTVLDRVLVDAARSAGAEFRFGMVLTDFVRAKSGRICGIQARDSNGDVIEIQTDMVIGADGRQSQVARLAEAQVYRQARNSTGVVFGYFDDFVIDGFQWYFGKNTAAGAIPTNDGQTCVFVSAAASEYANIFQESQSAGFRTLAEANSKSLAARLDQASLAGKLRGFIGCPGYFRQSYGDGWALVGDAGYFKDPMTAHGITDALRDAGLLADALTGASVNDLALYQSWRDVLSAELFQITDAVASFDWDMSTVKKLHHKLSNSMKSECEYLAQSMEAPKLAA